MTTLRKPLRVWNPEDPTDSYTAPRGIPAQNIRFVGDGWLVDLDVELDGIFVTQKSASKPLTD